MLSNFLSGYRRSGTGRTPVIGPPRPARFRPKVEALDERLAPGDTVVGALLFGPLAGPGLDDWDAVPLPPESPLGAGRPAEHRPFDPDLQSVPEGGRSTVPPPFAYGPSPTRQPPDRTGTPGGRVTARHAGFNWEGPGAVLPATGSARPFAPGGGRVLDAAPGAGSVFPAGVGYPASGRVAGPTGAAPEPAAAPEVSAAGGRVALGSCRAGPAVHARFDVSSLRGSPFPSNAFTVADPTQNTGRRVDLPRPDPATNPSDDQDMQVLNTLDGFNLQPRLSVPFDGPIDVNSVSSDTVFLIRLGDTLDHQDRGGQVVGINQVVWDVATNTLYVESDQLLDQHTRYALIVTCGVRDLEGQPVGASESFRRFRDEVDGDYKHDLLDGVQAAHQLGIPERHIVTASVFTTVSATAVLEKIRDQIHAATPAPADFRLGPGETRTDFPLDAVTGITVNQQTGANPSRFTPFEVPVGFLRLTPGAVGRLAFGRYLSPDYEVHSGEYIPPVGTRTGVPQVQGWNEVYFNLYLPSGQPPAAGWPVAIYGHGAGGTKQGGAIGGSSAATAGSVAVAASLARQGIATLAINAVGHGFGPLGTLTVNRTADPPVTFPAGGRGIDQNGDGNIGNNEGISAAAPRSILRDRDGQLQTVADLMQLVRVIEVGVDADGDARADLNPSRIYYVGQSLGGICGTEFLAVEPSVRVGVANVAGGSSIESNRLSVIFRASVGASLASRTPSLLNGPGVTHVDGVPVGAPPFDENMPLRDGVPLVVRLADGAERVIQSPVINAVPGVMPIQEVIEHTEWVSQSGNPVAYAPHVRKLPLKGVPPKSVLYQFAVGDQITPNPANSAIMRAGALEDRATFYRHDLAFAEAPTLPKNPHSFLTSVGIPAFRAIALGAQEQIAAFFASDGAVVIHPEPNRFFEVPIAGPPPEGLNFIP